MCASTCGREAVLYIAKLAEVLGESPYSPRPIIANAVASTHSIVRLYPRNALLAEFRRNPQMAEAFMAMFAHQVMSLRTRLQLRDICSARETYPRLFNNQRWRRRLHSLVTRNTQRPRRILGLTHEVLYRTLAEMASDREIKRSGKTITLSTRRK